MVTKSHFEDASQPDVPPGQTDDLDPRFSELKLHLESRGYPEFFRAIVDLHKSIHPKYCLDIRDDLEKPTSFLSICLNNKNSGRTITNIFFRIRGKELICSENVRLDHSILNNTQIDDYAFLGPQKGYSHAYVFDKLTDKKAAHHVERFGLYYQPKYQPEEVVRSPSFSTPK